MSKLFIPADNEFGVFVTAVYKDFSKGLQCCIHKTKVNQILHAYWEYVSYLVIHMWELGVSSCHTYPHTIHSSYYVRTRSNSNLQRILMLGELNETAVCSVQTSFPQNVMCLGKQLRFTN